MSLEAVDLLFADRDGKRPSIFRVVRDSRSKEFLAKMESTLQELARERGVEKEVQGDEKFDVAYIDKAEYQREV